MSLSDFIHFGAYRDLQQMTLLQMLERDPPVEPGYIDEPEIGNLTTSAMTGAGTKLQRFKILELALWNYNGSVSSPLDILIPSLMTEDQALTIDVILDVWMRAPIHVVPLMAPYLATTHQPERLRQMIGAVAHELEEEIGTHIPDRRASASTIAREQREGRKEVTVLIAQLASAMLRLQTMNYKNEQLPEFAAGVVIQLRRARDASVISDRDLSKLQASFLDVIHQPGRPDLVRRANQRLLHGPAR